ncbi:MAG: hypothetical protein JW936_02860 [Sedimentisphaerales bacterium]|nr:hypothetical protein [Sedimentisphaerales bacterium]
MNEQTQQLLNLIQTKFPIHPRPFLQLAQQLNTTESQVIQKIQQLQQDQIIRRVAAIFDAAHLGYVSTLVAAQVPADRLDQVVADVNALPGVSHNYARDHKLNLWFTLTVPRVAFIDQTLQTLRQDHQLPQIFSLPAQKIYKLNVNFNFSPVSPMRPIPDATNPCKPPKHTPTLTPIDKALIRRLQQNIPIQPEPFNLIAAELNTDISFVLQSITTWKAAGIIRRFGASIHHRQAGFNANGMIVLQLPDQLLDQAGTQLAQYSQISHCYHRATAPDWPYNLYAMAHCRTLDALNQLTAQLTQTLKPIQHQILISTAEYKKQPVQYFAE